LKPWIDYVIEIPGKPIAKKRPKFFRRGSHVGTYNPQVTEEGRWIIFARDALAGAGYPRTATKGVPVRLLCHFVFEYPASMPKKWKAGNPDHVKKPDADNCLKFVKDCLNGIAWHDDSQVYHVTGWKMYGETAKTVITISLPNPDFKIAGAF
jgi:Holliday junction resolvase RusA-like endonuclease